MAKLHGKDLVFARTGSATVAIGIGDTNFCCRHCGPLTVVALETQAAAHPRLTSKLSANVSWPTSPKSKGGQGMEWRFIERREGKSWSTFWLPEPGAVCLLTLLARQLTNCAIWPTPLPASLDWPPPPPLPPILCQLNQHSRLLCLRFC